MRSRSLPLVGCQTAAVPHAPRSVLPILFQDAYLIAVHKPSGLLVHRSDLDRQERRVALQMLRDQIGREVHPVHRLDRGASGVLLFALDRDTARAASRLFESREVEKSYLAVVRGWPPEQGEIVHLLRRRPNDYECQGKVAEAASQEAATRFRRLAVTDLPYSLDTFPSSRYALLLLEPITGRRHQLRRHLKHIAHPIIGDSTYGKGRHNRLFRKLFGCERLLLACVELRLRHPVTAEPITLTAPLPPDFTELLVRLGWSSRVPGRWLTETDPPS